MKMTWDGAEASRDFADVTVAIFDAGLVQAASNNRYRVIGIIDSRAMAMIFKPLGSEAISILSLRPASRRERSLL